MEYAAGSELKAELQQSDSAFTRDDGLYEQLVAAASRAIDDFTWRSFETPAEATTRVFRLAPCRTRVVDLDDIASTTNLAVALWDGSSYTALDASAWWATTSSGVGEVELPGMVTAIDLESAATAYRRPEVRVTALWGWPDVPSPVHRACLLWARRLYTRKDSPAGVLGFGDMGAVRLSINDPDVVSLLGPYRLLSRRLA